MKTNDKLMYGVLIAGALTAFYFFAIKPKKATTNPVISNVDLTEVDITKDTGGIKPVRGVLTSDAIGTSIVEEPFKIKDALNNM